MMNREYQTKFNWKSVLGAIALSVGALGIVESPAQAIPEVTQDSLKLAQILIPGRIKPPIPPNISPRHHIPLPPKGRRVNTPVPLNISPRHHIPLPPSNRRSDYYHHSRSNRDSYGRYNHHDQYGYDEYRHDDRNYDRHQSRQRRGGTVIIINPPNSSSYSNYNTQKGSVRVIRK